MSHNNKILRKKGVNKMVLFLPILLGLVAAPSRASATTTVAAAAAIIRLEQHLAANAADTNPALGERRAR